jgi:hypothetical protein
VPRRFWGIGALAADADTHLIGAEMLLVYSRNERAYGIAGGNFRICIDGHRERSFVPS